MSDGPTLEQLRAYLPNARHGPECERLAWLRGRDQDRDAVPPACDCGYEVVFTAVMGEAEPAPSLSQQMWDASARVERIIHVPTMLACEAFDADDLIDEIDDPPPALATCLGITAEQLDEIVGSDRRMREEYIQEAAAMAKDAPPWLVFVSHPVERKLSETGCRCSWGHYTTQAFAGWTFEGAVAAGIAWVDADHEAVMAGEIQK